MNCDVSMQRSDDDDDSRPIMFLTKRDTNFDADKVTVMTSSIIIGRPISETETHFTNNTIIPNSDVVVIKEKSLIQVLEECGIRAADESHLIESHDLHVANRIGSDVVDAESMVTKMCCSEQGNDHTKVNSFEDREFEFLRAPPTIQRCTSLKQTSKKSDGTGATRKSVRFADALGLDLASIRHIINPEEPPSVPSCTWRTYARKDEHAANEEVAFWRVRFIQPVVTSLEFRQRVQDRKVALESCSINNQDLTAHGVVRVANIAFVKDVKVRFSYNGWLTHQDVQARYIANSNDLVSDRFYFVFSLPGHLGVRNRIEFAILYSANGEIWWDSNLGYNYTVECIHYLGRE